MPTYIISTSRGDLEVDADREPTADEADKIAKQHFGESGQSTADAAIGVGIEVGGAVLGGMAGAAVAPITGGVSIPVGAMLGGAAGNYIKQRMEVGRGERADVSAGQVVGTSLLSAVPVARATAYAAKATGIAIPALIKAGQGATTALAAEVAEKAIDEGRLPDAAEAAYAAGMGGLMGGVLGGLEKRYQMKGALITNNAVARAVQGATGLGVAAYTYNDARESGDSEPLQKAVLYGALTVGGTFLPSLIANANKSEVARRILGPEAIMKGEGMKIVRAAENELRGAEFEAKKLGTLLNETIAKQAKPAAVEADVLSVLDGKVNKSILSTYSRDFDPIISRFEELRERYSDTIVRLFPNMDQELSDTITRNRGSYIRTAYAAFDKKNAIAQVDYDEPAKRLAFKTELSSRLQAGGKSAADADGEAERIMGRMIGDVEFVYSGGWEKGAGTSAGSALMEKGNLSKALREWLGEVSDPGKRVANTLNAQSRLVMNAERDKAMREFLLRTGIGTTGSSPAQGYVTMIPSETSTVHQALADIQVPEVFAKAYKEVLDPNLLGDGPISKWFMTATGLSKASKTLGNMVEAIAPQAIGNMMLAASSMKLNPLTLAKSAADVWKSYGWKGYGGLDAATKVAFNKESAEAVSLGVMRGGADVQELRKFMSSSVVQGKKPEDIMEAFSKVYGFPDSAVRYMMWKQNVKEISGFSPGLGLDAIKRKAAQVTNDQFPTYENIPRRLRQASALMMANAFGAFEFEVVRNSVNQVKYAKQLMSEGRATGNNAMMLAGAKRIMSLAAVGTATIGLGKAMNKWMGTSEQDEKDARFFIPTYDADKANVVRIGADGKFSYAPLNYLAPHANSLQLALVAPVEGQSPLPYAKSIFLGNDLGPLGTAAMESLTNNYYGTSVKISEPRDNRELAGRFLTRAFMPQAIAGTMTRVDKALRGETNKLGSAPSLMDAALRVAGYRQNTMDVLGAATTRIRDLAEPVVGEQTGYRQIIKREQQSGRSSLNEPALYAERNANYEKGQERLREAYLALTRISDDGRRGFKQPDIIRAFKEAGVPNKLVAGAVFGYKVPMARGIDESNTEFVERVLEDPKLKKNATAALDARAGGDAFKRKALYEAYRNVMRSNAKGIDPVDKLLGGLDVGSGERAEHIARIIANSPAASREIKLNLINKGIITREVYAQLAAKGL